MDFRNCYADDAYAAAYAKLEFPGTYYLAFRDLPELFARHVRGRRALDFGCGTGRSTRFLVNHGFQAVGVDIAAEMIQRARAIDPDGDYRLIPEGHIGTDKTGKDPTDLTGLRFDLILAAFTFDNVPTRERKVALFRDLQRLLAPEGRLVNLISSPEIYWHEWASFSTQGFPANRQARCGEQVRIINTALDDRRPAVDILWPEEAYREVYAAAGLRVLDVHRPLGRPDEPYGWVSETTVAPWTIYILGQTPDTEP
jgi:SAM-dependent methyltransferase